MNSPSLQKRLWSIVLAGGEGERLRPLIRDWTGRSTPKQYCTFIGTRSMFQHTVDRADRLTDPERRVTVIGRSHRREALGQLAGRASGKIILQPANRETAVGIYLALTVIHKADPEAVVVIYPSDHFVYPEGRFMKIVRSLVTAAEQLSNRLCLLGVSPDRFDPDHGWIQPGSCLTSIHGHQVRAVENFLEKPPAPQCRLAARAGALWNTLILAGRLNALWQMGWHYFPDIMELLVQYQAAIGSRHEVAVLESIYPLMPIRNFSMELLQNASSQIAVMELKGVIWSDWGRPERILATLRQIGKRPAFLQAHSASA